MLMVFLLLYLAPLLDSVNDYLFSCVPCLSCYGRCAMIKIQLGLLYCVMSSIVLLTDLAVLSVGRGLEPPIPVLKLLHGGI